MGPRCKIIVCGGKAAGVVEAVSGLNDDPGVTDAWRTEVAVVFDAFIAEMDRKFAALLGTNVAPNPDIDT